MARSRWRLRDVVRGGPAVGDAARQELARRFGDEAAVLCAWLRSRAQRLVRHATDLDDLSQEVWVRAVQLHDRYAPERCAFRTWLLGIAANVVLEAVRRDRQRGRMRFDEGHSSLLQWREEMPANLTSLTQRVVRGEAMQSLFAALAQRDAVDQRVFELRGLEARAHADVAARCSITVAQAEKRWQRLAAFLRAHLERLGIEVVATGRQ